VGLCRGFMRNSKSGYRGKVCVLQLYVFILLLGPESTEIGESRFKDGGMMVNNYFIDNLVSKY
jgi:hypothetical protein